MPFREINGASLYYETLGVDRPNRAPVVLIHGATGTGRSNWSLVAPLLAREYRIIVPDCRGHGQSGNPQRSYSFAEMAADTAALVRALGYPRAHIIGHSNGGNVALVTLLEHPDVVQTCIAQAANAYVSSDLVEKEPAIFDPARVAREAPHWMHDMIALHGETHGPDYWRDLLRMTVQEIISQPNYTPVDLAKVTRPTLVIQGEIDHVNAPAGHARFIAQHIPDAELWIPCGVGHTVHDEILFDWIARVLDFLSRRGDDANAALDQLRRSRYADPRATIFDVHLAPPLSPPRSGGDERGGIFSGRVLTQAQHRAALDVLPEHPAEDRVRILLSDDAPWALVNCAVADVRREPHSLAERVSQALIGEALRVIDQSGEWYHVRLEHDGYLGWMQSSALHLCDQTQALAYRADANGLIVAELAQAFLARRLSPPRSGEDERENAGKLPFAVTLPIADRSNGCVAVRLPDGRVWWLIAADVIDVSKRPKPDVDGIAFALRRVQRSVGVPYLWGGRSPFGYDCSGLAQTFWSFLGVQIPRDADQQFCAGASVEGQPQPGDLLFFGEAAPSPSSPQKGEDERQGITHVAISLGGNILIHANGTARGISLNSLDPSSLIYRAWLRDHLAGVRRYQV